MSTTGSMIDELYKLREQKRAHEEAIKQLSDQMSGVEAQLLKQLDAEGITKATGNRASISVSLNVRPSVTDWDEFYRYIHRNKMYHLLERRPSVSGCQELFETKGKIPGVVPFTHKRINMRSL